MADADSQGRRNWSKCKDFADVIDTHARVFAGDCVTRAALSELTKQDEQAVHPAVASRIEQLLKLQKQGADVQVQLDTQLFISLLPTGLQGLFLDRIQVLPAHLLHAEQVDDIGFIVRDVLLHIQRHSVLAKIYQYTMPFIKHNRLNFPPMRYVSKSLLMHMLQTTALMCLGLYRPGSKKPTWNIRRQLFIFFSRLATRGSLRDIYLFFHSHTYVLRLALMEHFMHYTKTKMMHEIHLLERSSARRYDFARLQRMVEYITDNFRMTSLQNETLDWALVESKAQVCVERCNRSCKTHPTQMPVAHRCLADCLDVATFRGALRLPRLTAVGLAQACCEHDMLHTAARWSVSMSICKYPLPVLCQHQQFEHIQRMSLQTYNRTIVSRSLLYACLRCNLQHPEARTDMRLQYPHLPICTRCNSNAYVCVADTLGHLVRVYGHYYYFCVVCNKVHVWQASGSELVACPETKAAQRAETTQRKQCAVCVRNMFLSQVTVFDKRLGLMQSLFLCSKHCPPPAQMQYVYDLASLRRLVTHLV